MTDTPKTSPRGDMKHDDGKSRVDLIDPQFTINMGYVMAYGAKKYAEESWKTDVANPIPRYLAASMRHLLAFASGQLTDEESGLPTLSHAACSLMMLQHHVEREQANADRLLADLKEVLERHAMSGEIHVILGDNTDTDEGDTDVQAGNYRTVGDSKPRANHVAGRPKHNVEHHDCGSCSIRSICGLLPAQRYRIERANFSRTRG